MLTYNFYYDESEHSRKINYNTVTAPNYYDNFVTAIVGWSSEKEKEVFEKYADFEDEYAERKDRNGEIKSTTLKQKQFKFGFASLDEVNTQFINDFLTIFDEDAHVYFSVFSKIEYLVLQFFAEYENDFLFDADAMKYSITKALVKYRPEKVIKCIYECPEQFVDMLKDFFSERIACNEANTELTEMENRTFLEILHFLGDISAVPVLQWDYHLPFYGFRKYLKEKGIQKYSFLVDKEGEDGKVSNTLKAAREVGLQNSNEADSKSCAGLRMADMMAGIISKLLKALRESLRYQSDEEAINKKILNIAWFQLNDSQLALYKKLYIIICEWQPAWYKSYSGVYSDDFVIFIALLNFMNHFQSAEQIQETIEMQGEYFNTFVCKQLSESFELKKCKLPMDPVISVNKETYLNQRGATVYFESEKQPLLHLHEGSQVFEVLSVGVTGSFIPLATILQDGNQVCYRLPQELSGWACSVAGFAAMGTNMFPSKVMFSKIEGNYYADIV